MISSDYKYQLLSLELIQAEEEGKDVSGIRKEFEALDKTKIEMSELDGIYEQIMRSQVVKGWSYHEPDDIHEIGQQSSPPDGVERWTNWQELSDRMLGAWLGRIAGNMLGKPVEGWPKQKIDEYLKRAGCYPLDDYIPELIPHREGMGLNSLYTESGGVRGKIQRALRDDDIDYTILGLLILERKGFGFTTQDVANEWLERLPLSLTYTAEREVYRNLTLGMKPPECASFWNPFREWVGAQIRADPWGYACALRPWMAAETAYRDACLSHVKNGIYGEMYVAAMVADAFYERDPSIIVQRGLSCIPKQSRLAEAIRVCLDLWKGSNSFDVAYDQAMSKYGHYVWFHTINNAVIVTLSILFGEGDYSKSICLSVSGGLDTDCNGATVGSIIGAMSGAKVIPAKWTGPLNDNISTALSGLADLKISSLSDRMVNIVTKGWS